MVNGIEGSSCRLDDEASVVSRVGELHDQVGIVLAQVRAVAVCAQQDHEGPRDAALLAQFLRTSAGVGADRLGDVRVVIRCGTKRARGHDALLRLAEVVGLDTADTPQLVHEPLLENGKVTTDTLGLGVAQVERAVDAEIHHSRSEPAGDAPNLGQRELLEHLASRWMVGLHDAYATVSVEFLGAVVGDLGEGAGCAHPHADGDAGVALYRSP